MIAHSKKICDSINIFCFNILFQNSATTASFRNQGLRHRSRHIELNRSYLFFQPILHFMQKKSMCKMKISNLRGTWGDGTSRLPYITKRTHCRLSLFSLFDEFRRMRIKLTHTVINTSITN